MADDDRPDTTVVVASVGDAARDLLGRIVESTGHRAVLLDRATADEVAGAVWFGAAVAVVLDLGRDTLPVLRALADHPDLGDLRPRVIAVTHGPSGATEALEAGAHAALGRPFPAADLVAALTEVAATVSGDRPGPHPVPPASEPDDGTGDGPDDLDGPGGDPLLDLQRRA